MQIVYTIVCLFFTLPRRRKEILSKRLQRNLIAWVFIPSTMLYTYKHILANLGKNMVYSIITGHLKLQRQKQNSFGANYGWMNSFGQMCFMQVQQSASRLE